MLRGHERESAGTIGRILSRWPHHQRRGHTICAGRENCVLYRLMRQLKLMAPDNKTKKKRKKFYILVVMRFLSEYER